MKLKVTLFLVLLAGAGIVVAIGMTRFEEPVTFRDDADQMLRSFYEGNLDKIYEESSPHFRRIIHKDRFVEIVRRMREGLGNYQKITRVRDVESNKEPKGETARIAMDLQFEKATTTGQLSFHKIAGTWRLLGVSVKVPKSLRKQIPDPVGYKNKDQAPEEVQNLLVTLLGELSEGKVDEAYRNTGSRLFRKSISGPDFEALVKRQVEELGPFNEIIAVLSSYQNRRKNRARIRALLQYEKRRTTADFEFEKYEGEWRLLLYRVSLADEAAGAVPQDK